MFTQKNGHLRL